MGLFLSSLSAGGSSFFFVSFFVRSEPVSSPRPTNPRRCRAQGLSRLAVAPMLPRAPIIARPYLDDSEHDGTLGVVGMTYSRGVSPGVDAPGYTIGAGEAAGASEGCPSLASAEGDARDGDRRPAWSNFIVWRLNCRPSTEQCLGGEDVAHGRRLLLGDR
jgi:hypothetical protein